MLIKHTIQRMGEQADAFTLKIDRLTTEEAAIIELSCNKYGLNFQKYSIIHIVDQTSYNTVDLLVFFVEQDIKNNTMQVWETDIITHLPVFNAQFQALRDSKRKQFSVTTVSVELEAWPDLSLLAQELGEMYPSYRKSNVDIGGRLVDYTVGIEDAYLDEADSDCLREICDYFDLSYSQNDSFLEIRFKSEQLALGVLQKWREAVIRGVPCLFMTLTSKDATQTTCNIYDEQATAQSQRQARSLFESSAALREQHRFFSKLHNQFLQTQPKDDDVQHAYDMRYGLRMI